MIARIPGPARSSGSSGASRTRQRMSRPSRPSRGTGSRHPDRLVRVSLDLEVGKVLARPRRPPLDAVGDHAGAPRPDAQRWASSSVSSGRDRGRRTPPSVLRTLMTAGRRGRRPASRDGPRGRERPMDGGRAPKSRDLLPGGPRAERRAGQGVLGQGHPGQGRPSLGGGPLVGRRSSCNGVMHRQITGTRPLRRRSSGRPGGGATLRGREHLRHRRHRRGGRDRLRAGLAHQRPRAGPPGVGGRHRRRRPRPLRDRRDHPAARLHLHRGDRRQPRDPRRPLRRRRADGRREPHRRAAVGGHGHQRRDRHERAGHAGMERLLGPAAPRRRPADQAGYPARALRRRQPQLLRALRRPLGGAVVLAVHQPLRPGLRRRRRRRPPRWRWPAGATPS